MKGEKINKWLIFTIIFGIIWSIFMVSLVINANLGDKPLFKDKEIEWEYDTEHIIKPNDIYYLCRLEGADKGNAKG